MKAKCIQFLVFISRIWDRFFTLIDNVQLKIWFKLTQYIERIKHGND